MKRKWALAWVCAALATLMANPAPAAHPRQWVPLVVGQEIFSAKNTRVGTLERYIDVRGTPGVIIAADPTFGRRKIIAPAQDLSKRDAGGLLLVLSDSSIAKLPTYQPDYLPFW